MHDGLSVAGAVFHVSITDVRRARVGQPARHPLGAIRPLGESPGSAIHAVGGRLRVLRPPVARVQA
eukprot:3123414-Rhodomonas_salina.2